MQTGFFEEQVQIIVQKASSLMPGKMQEKLSLCLREEAEADWPQLRQVWTLSRESEHVSFEACTKLLN